MTCHTNARLCGLTVSAFIVTILTMIILGAGQWLLDVVSKALFAVAVGAFLRWSWNKIEGKMLQKGN